MNGYTKTTWVDNSVPVLNAENLNHIESGIEAVTNAAINTDREIAAARGTYANLKERLDHTGAEKFVEVTDTSDTAVDNCTDPDTVYIVKVVSGVVSTARMRVVCSPTVVGGLAQYAMSKDGYIITRKYDGSEWSAWDFIPNNSRVVAMISAVNQAVTAAEGRITTNESKIGTLEQEYQTVDQDLSDIMDEMPLVEKTGNKVNIINPATPSNTDYPTTAAVIEYVNSLLRGLTNGN